MALGNEPVRVAGEIVGRVTTRGLRLHASAARSPTPTCPPSQAEPETEVAVEIFGRWVDGEVAEEPLFDLAASASAS